MGEDMEMYQEYETFITEGESVPASKIDGNDVSTAKLGLTSLQARESLIQAVLDCVDDSSRTQKLESTILREKLSEPSRWVLLFCAVLIALGYHLNPQRPQMIAEVVILILNNLLNIWLSVTDAIRKQCEIAERVHAAVLNFADNMEEMTETGVRKNTVLSPSPSYVAVFRDEMWQRMPMNLLVAGDVIALMSGDVAPGDAYLLQPRVGGDSEYTSSRETVDDSGGGLAKDYTLGFKITRGTRVPGLDRGPTHIGQRTNATNDPQLLLGLCGDMRCFFMLETPVVKNIVESLSPPKRPDTMLHRQAQHIYRLLSRVAAVCMVVFFLATFVRILMLGFHVDWGDELLSQPVHLALCFLMLSMPSAMMIAECLSTAHNMVLLEQLLDQQHHLRAHQKDMPSSPQFSANVGSPGSAAAARDFEEFDEVDFEERQIARSKHQYAISKRRLWLYFKATIRFRVGSYRWAHGSPSETPKSSANSSDDPVSPCPTSSASPPRTSSTAQTPTERSSDPLYASVSINYGSIAETVPLTAAHAELDQNYEEQQEGSKMSHYWHCFKQQWKSVHRRSFSWLSKCFRLKSTSAIRPTLSSSSSSLSYQEQLKRPLLPVPFLSARLLERLGAITVLCCLDDDVLCEPDPSPEEVFILKDNEGATAVLDLHVDKESKTGVRQSFVNRTRYKKHHMRRSGHYGTHSGHESPARHQRTASASHSPSRQRGMSLTSTTAVASGAPGGTGAGGAARVAAGAGAPVQSSSQAFHKSNSMPTDDDHFPKRGTHTFHSASPQKDRRRFRGSDRSPALGEAERESSKERGETGGETERGPLSSAIQSLADHVRRLPNQEYLTHLAREVGFCDEDLDWFLPRQKLHSVSPLLAYAEHTEDTHAQGFEDTRLRGNLRSHFCSVVVLDTRSEGYQVLSKGHPTIAINQCSEFWDGRSICPISAEGRRAIADIYNQWRLEDFECVAFSYCPVNASYDSLFDASDVSQVLPPLYLIDGGLKPQAYRDAQGRLAVANGNNEKPSIANDTSGMTRSRSAPTLFKEQETEKKEGESLAAETSEQKPQTELKRFKNEEHLLDKKCHRTRSWNMKRTRSRRRSLESPTVGEAETALADDTADPQWRLLGNQIFLGMAASSAQPKVEVSQLYEDLRASGIRFVYFSPRNMRRSKPLVEKMGIETDWNCAISLRPLDSDEPDPHRMTSNYSDWDVKARLPHGIEAIRTHLEEVDNVPLLVSVYTDSTPEDSLEMLKVFQEHNEVICTVGNALRASNAPLFEQADIAIALHGQPLTMGAELPQTASAPMLSAADLELSASLNTMACAITMNGSKDGLPRLLPLITLIKSGRRWLTNVRQGLLFGMAAQVAVGLVFTAAEVMPVPQSARISGLSLLWLLWVIIPALSLSFLASPSDKAVMSRTPSKNTDHVSELGRFSAYFVIRIGPSILLCLIVFSWIMGHSLSLTATDPIEKQMTCFQLVYKRDLYGRVPTPPRLEAAMRRGEATMLLLLVLSFCASSHGFMYRVEGLRSEPPYRNKVWVWCVAAVVILQFLYGLMWTAGHVKDGSLVHLYIFDQPWALWLVLLIWPFIVVYIDEVVKRHDKIRHDRYFRYLRMQFDTRLGMWSPR